MEFAVAAAAVLALAVAAGSAWQAGFAPYPSLHMAAGPVVIGLASGLVVAALAPFADRRGVGR